MSSTILAYDFRQILSSVNVIDKITCFSYVELRKVSVFIIILISETWHYQSKWDTKGNLKTNLL